MANGPPPRCVNSNELVSVIPRLNDQLDHDSEVYRMTSIQLQVLMDRRSTLLLTASDMKTSVSDTGMTVVGNPKE